MLQPATIKFLKGLKKNNNKPWFDAHRKEYEDARADFARFVQTLIDGHSRHDPAIASLKAKDCMFRINRDIRFSKDKSPYKTNFGASINKGGKNAFAIAGYYFHLEPGQSFIGGGMYQPEPDVLKKVRQEIDYNFESFKKIIGAKKFKSLYGDLNKDPEFLLSRMPKGYEADHPAADYLRLKSYIAFVQVTDEELTEKNLLKKSLVAMETLRPVIEFLNNIL